MSFLQVRLARDSLETPWGFRMQGGKDLNQPLTVQRVFTNTPSEGELQRGDLIISINGRDTDALTHKQAQDQIKYGGGQIDLFIKRPPPGQTYIKPLSPTKDTRAPTFPYSPTKAPQIQIPIRRRHSGPPSPTRIIPISPSKPSPKSPPKPAPKPGTDPSMAYTSGFKPTKITLNKYGGGGMDFGYAPKTPPTHAPQPAQAYHPPSPPRQQYQPSPPQPTFKPQTQEERGVEEEEYGGVSERRRKFLNRQEPPPQIHHTRKPVPTYGRARGDDSPVFGSDYTGPPTYQTLPKAKKAPRPRPPPVNARVEVDEMDGPSPWSQTLRSDTSLKPWEKEAREHEFYQSASASEPFHPSHHAPAPMISPKPRITQISAQSVARPQAQSSGPRSVSPSVPRKPQHSPIRSPIPQQQYNSYEPSYEPRGGVSEYSEQPNIVHLQYNSPMGLYSKDNIRDAYIGQKQAVGRALKPASAPQKQPVPLGQRDWGDSYVYQMVHEESKKSTTTDVPGHPEQSQTVTTTRVTDETRRPGEEPHRTVKETVTRSGPQQLPISKHYGISDF